MRIRGRAVAVTPSRRGGRVHDLFDVAAGGELADVVGDICTRGPLHGRRGRAVSGVPGRVGHQYTDELQGYQESGQGKHELGCSVSHCAPAFGRSHSCDFRPRSGKEPFSQFVALRESSVPKAVRGRVAVLPHALRANGERGTCVLVPHLAGSAGHATGRVLPGNSDQGSDRPPNIPSQRITCLLYAGLALSRRHRSACEWLCHTPEQ